MKTISFLCGALPGEKDESQAGKRPSIGMSLSNGFSLHRDAITLNPWAAVAVRRRLRSKRSARVWRIGTVK
ncbi:MAG TPA: hypothetical protein VLC71_09690 [Thermomonas sp.]|nr:hypothetical protein [Thermomonas sp.]